MANLDLKYKIIAKDENGEESETLVVTTRQQFTGANTCPDKIDNLEGKPLLINITMTSNQFIEWSGSINWVKNKMYIFRTGLRDYEMNQTSMAMYMTFLHQCDRANLISWQELEGILLDEIIQTFK